MDNRIHSIIATVQRRECMKRRNARLIIAVLLISTISVLAVLVAYYPTWMLLLWIAPLIVAFLIAWKAPRESLSVSTEEASLLLDSHLNTKERVRTFSYLALSSAAPDIVRGTFIAQQIHEHIEPSFSPAHVVSLRLSRSQQIALTCGVTCATLALALYILRPLSAREEIVRTMAEILANDHTIPDDVRLATEQAIQDLSSSDFASAQESLQRAEEEVLKALESATENTSKERTIQASTTDRDSSQPTQESSPPTQSPQRDQARREQQNENRKTNEEDKEQSQQQEKNKPNDEKKQEKEQSSQEKAPGGDSEKGSDDDSRKEEQSQQSKSQQGGNSSSGQSEESKDGEGQGGGGQGGGASGAGTGSQGENQQQQGASQGSSGSSNDGQGEGKGSGKESQGSLQPKQGSGGEQGQPQTGGTTGATGLEQLKDSLQKAEQALSQEQAQQKGASPQGSEGKDAGEKKGASDKGNEGKNQGNSQKGDAPSNGQSPSGSSNSTSPQNNKGTGRSGSSPNSKKEDARSPGSQGSTANERPKNDPKSQNDSGLSSPQGEAPKPDRQTEQNDAKNSGNGAGELSSMPDRSAQPSTDDPGEGPGSGSSNLPVEFTESEIGSTNEQLDSRFTGSEATTEKNKLPATAKTTLDDVLLAKPQGSVHRGEQPIPLEYRELLEKRQ